MKHLLPLAVLSLTLAACNAQTPTVTGTSTSSIAVSPDQVMTLPPATDATLEWWAKNTGTNADGVPQNILTLRTVGNGAALYTGNCVGTTLVQGVPDMDGSVAYIQCWWAGGGDQYAVFKKGDKNVVRHRTVDEEAGYGQWEDLKTL